jgi:hypothetical protein
MNLNYLIDSYLKARYEEDGDPDAEENYDE